MVCIVFFITASGHKSTFVTTTRGTFKAIAHVIKQDDSEIVIIFNICVYTYIYIYREYGMAKIYHIYLHMYTYIAASGQRSTFVTTTKRGTFKAIAYSE